MEETGNNKLSRGEGIYYKIKAAFEKLRNTERAKKMSAYMRDQFEYYGIPTPERRASYKNILRNEKKINKIDWELLDKCWEDNYREFQYFVMDYLSAMQNILRYEDIMRIERYLNTKQWWDTIDGLDMIVGKIGLKDPRVDDLMLQWSKDENFWIRRIAIDHQLCRKENTNTELLEKILVNNLGSDEFFINKAIGWSLRDYSKTNPGWVSNFIKNYRHIMSPLSIREASKYL